MAAMTNNTKTDALPYILDMVHHNPGEDRYDSAYNDPRVLREMGYNGKVSFLFDSPTLAVNWDSVDADILPAGSDDRVWVEHRARRIHEQLDACKAAGLKAYALGDLMLFPKRLVEKHGIAETFGDPRHEQSEQWLRTLIDLVFEQFPQLDGLVVRIGETYLHDAPYHIGNIREKRNVEETIVPLGQVLRDAVCVKNDKVCVFRSWMSFDYMDNYPRVSDAIEPHHNLVLAVKHCEHDFHRGNAFSAALGVGRHPQIVEVQCAREYEGKGAYPNYVTRGVIEGFEEHAHVQPINSIRDLHERTDLMAGIWTWTRGGGWEGPYIPNELWCDLNAWVVAQWANQPAESEENLFARYCAERLKLDAANAAIFRQIALLSEAAVLRGRRSTQGHLYQLWNRDQYIGWPDREMPQTEQERQLVLKEKRESIEAWRQIVDLADQLEMPDAETLEFVRVSCRYGLHIHRVYSAVVHLACRETDATPEELKQYVDAYDAAWADFRQLRADHPETCPTLYDRREIRRTRVGLADDEVERIRRSVAST